jgi:hypothetical protein
VYMLPILQVSVCDKVWCLRTASVALRDISGRLKVSPGVNLYCLWTAPWCHCVTFVDGSNVAVVG